MSQVATLLRISEQAIYEFIASPGIVTPENINASAKGSAEFHGSFVALEYLLAKNQPTVDRQLLGEIFNPTDILGEPVKIGDAHLQFFEMLEAGKSAPYINKQKVVLISSLLEDISLSYIASRYNASELNREKIYPCCWHNGTGSDQSFNERHIITDCEILKNLFVGAAKEGDCIVSIIS